MNEPLIPGFDDLVIESAAARDFAAILSLNEAAVPHVNHIEMPELERLAAQSMAFTVARRGPDIAGFLLVLPDGSNYASLNYRYFADRYPRFAYVDRIVVSANHRGAGVGSRLYAHLLAHGVADKPLVACEVNLLPPNPASVAFHNRLGFNGIDEQATEQGRKRVLMMIKELQT